MSRTGSFFCIGLGEILWDLLPSGRQLGGAPANFAYHAQALGAEAAVISRVGDDSAGRDILELLRAIGLPTAGIGIDLNAPTGTVSVELQPDGQPRFTIHEHVAWDRLTPEPAVVELAARADAVCFGTLGQRGARARESIHAILAATRPEAWRVFDVNLRQQFYSREIIEGSLSTADAVKLNDAELPVLAGMFGLRGDVRNQLADLAGRFGLRSVALTRGGKGSLLLAEGGWSDHPGVTANVIDTVGAGDAFTAAWTLGMLAEEPLAAINARANEVAAFVCGCPGATPAYPAGTHDR